jgi:acyl carrier protein
VLAVEEAFDIEIPDSAIGENLEDVSKTMTVQKLAEIVSKQKK